MNSEKIDAENVKPSFLLGLRERQPEKWAMILAALRQDSLIWEALESSDLGQRILERSPEDPQAWSPAALALVATGMNDAPAQVADPDRQPPDEATDIRSPQEPQDEAIETPVTLKEAGRLALAWQARIQEGGSWADILEGPEMNLAICPTALACVYAMLPEPENLLKAIVEHKAEHFLRHLTHIILCNFIMPEQQAAVLAGYLAILEREDGLKLLQVVSDSRPALAASLARGALEEGELPPWLPDERESPSQAFENLKQLLHTARYVELSGQAEKALPLLADAVRVLRRVRGDVSAQLAKVIDLAQQGQADKLPEVAQKTGLEAWRQAVQMAPDDPHYLAGLVNALVHAGQAVEARAMLEKLEQEQQTPAHAALWLASARLALSANDLETARRSAEQAFKLVLNGQNLTQSEYYDLMRAFWELKEAPQVLQSGQLAIQRHPTHPGLLALIGKAYYELGQIDQTLRYALAALAMDEANAGYSGSAAGVGQQVQIDRQEMQRLVIECLEQSDAWAEALKERQALMDQLQSPSARDWGDLAACAQCAGRYDIVLQACQRWLEVAPQDFQALLLAAEAALAMDDAHSAAQFYRQATTLAPERADLWVALAGVLRRTEQNDEALEALRAASQAAPEAAEIQLALGEAYLEMGEPTQALPALQKAHSLVPGNRRAALRLGQALYLLGHLSQSREVFQPAWEALQSGEKSGLDASNELDLAYMYARTLLDGGDASRAIPILKEIVQQRPGDPGPALDLASALLKIETQPSGAQRAASLLNHLLYTTNESLHAEHLAQYPDWRAQAQAMLADALMASGDLDHAMEAYRLALDMPYNRQPGRQEHLALGLGMAALRLNQPEMALAALQEAAQTEAHNPQMQRSLAEAYLANGLTEDAFHSAQTALSLAPDDINNLDWFIGQCRVLSKLPGLAGLPIQDEMIGALRKATELDKSQGERLATLGELLLERGESEEAIQVFRQLTTYNQNEIYVKPATLLRAAQAIRQKGDVQLAIRLLQMAIDIQSAKMQDGSPNRSDATLVNLYAELALAQQQASNLDAALRAYDRALALDSTRADLYQGMAELLSQMGRMEAALESLESAAQLSPADVQLSFRLAQMQRAAGNLPKALEMAIQTTQRAGSNEGELASQAHLAAAELSHQLLRPLQAQSYLQAGSASRANEFRYASLKAELALDMGNESVAAEAIAALSQLAPKHPRCLAAHARLACLRGDCAAGLELYQSAYQAWQALELDEPGVWTSADEAVMTLVSVCQAAMDTVQFNDAVRLANSLVEKAPQQPMAYFKQGQALLLRAEAQALCQDAEVRQHAISNDALEIDARQAFQQAMSEAGRLTSELPPLANDPAQKAAAEERQLLDIWSARGLCVFTPVAHHAQALQRMMKSFLPRADFVAALVMALRRCGDAKGAVMAAQLDWLPGYEGPGVTGNPQVLTQLALALAEINPEQALEVIEDALERLPVAVSGVWPESAILYYLMGREANRAGDFGKALQSLESALAVWPDEARWHALAAQICLQRDAEAGLPDRERALKHMEQAASLESGNILHHLALGRVYLESGNAVQAVQALGQASQLDPEQAEIWLALAQAQQAAGDLEGAAASAGRAAEGLADPTLALLLQGQLALSNHNPRLALNRAEALLQIKPDHGEGLYLLAQALQALDRPADALIALEKAMPIFSNPLPMQLERAHLVRKVRGVNAALGILRSLTEAYPEQPELLFLLAQWALQADQAELGLQAARNALQMGGDALTLEQRSELHFGIGQHMRQVGQLDQAILHLTQAIELAPTHLEAFLELGRAYQERREHRQALKIYQRAITVAGGDYRPYYLAGVALKDSKDYLAAEAMLRRATQLAPNEVTIHRLLGAVVALNLVHNRRLTPTE